MKYYFMPITLLTILCLLGCQARDLSPEQRMKEQHLVLNIFTEPPSLDPGKTTDASSITILIMLYEPLMRRSPQDVPEPGVAKSYEVSEDGKTYTFHLRESKWSNGDPVTAHDFEYAWKRVLNSKFPGDLAYELYVLVGAQEAKEGKTSMDNVGVKAMDDLTLVVNLVNPTPYFLELLQIPCFLPLHRASVVDNPDWAMEAGPNYIGNGPFKMESWTHHNELIVVKNPLYWDASAVKLAKIELLMVEDSNTELALFEDKAIDWAGKPVSMGLPTDSMPALLAEGKVEFHPVAGTYYYFLNTLKPPFTNVNIRRAFAYALDRKSIATNIGQSGEEPATCIVPPPLTLQDQECFEDDNVEEARRLFKLGLKELGMTKQQLPPIYLSYNTGEGHHKIAQAVQQQWNNAFGISVTLKNLEWKVYLDKMERGDFTIGRMSWLASYNDAYTFLDMFKHSNGYIRWSDPEYNELLNQALKETDSSKRRDLLKEAERILIDQMPAIPVYFLTNSFMKNPRLQGAYISPIGEVDFKRAYFE